MDFNITRPTFPKIDLNQPPFQTLDNHNEINRLIIIGNGFDLAHGLKSSFADFIYDYCFKVISKLLINLQYEDFFISIISTAHIADGIEFVSKMTKKEAFDELINLTKKTYMKFKWKSHFFQSIFKDVENKKWVDIEIQYFDFLKDNQRINNPKEINNLNTEFDFIKSLFLEYLQGEVVKKDIIPNNNLLRQFMQHIRPKDMRSYKIEKNQLPSKICILNFNYTNIAEKYGKEIILDNYKYIPIQAPIFGFGDEIDPDYEKVELLRNDELFKHIKSFKYLQFNHYRDLLEFIENNPYQVQIFGHSCGLSDRTLLNTIFEHENCISIKPFYFVKNGFNDYEQKSYAISRHFKSKSELRSKVVNKQYCEAMVQPLIE